MRTYRTPMNGGTPYDFTSSTWPDPPTSGDQIEVTEWQYQPATGLLLKKIYDDATTTSPSIAYTYTADGKMKTRVWRRGVTTTYSYNDGTGGTLATGELAKIEYSDATPGVKFFYDRLGRKDEVQQWDPNANNGVGDWSRKNIFSYADDGADSLLRLNTETITRDGYTKTITCDYESAGTGTVAGRDAGFHIGSEYNVDYGYDSVGRLNFVKGPGAAAYGVEYRFVAGTDLVEWVLFKNGSESYQAGRFIKYENDRDVIDYVENGTGPNTGNDTFTSTFSKYDYTNDDLGRRTEVDYTGTAFASTQYLSFGYNNRSEVTTADRYSDSNRQTHFTTKGEFDYAYDHIGNRETYQVDISQQTPTTDRTYTTDDVNRYTAATDPAETFSYGTNDIDGNMTGDLKLTYAWDAENRLIAVTPKDPVNGNYKYGYEYDYMGRRVTWHLYQYDNGAWPSSPTYTFHYVFDGWNVVMRWRDGVSSATYLYTWGLDLSGSIHGAGGVGGLLAWGNDTLGFNDAWYFYDGNGNVTQLLKRSNDSVEAHYEYDPYGNVISDDDGEFVDLNPFRFSTKWRQLPPCADAGDLYYYGHRWYSSRLGRWISRDPIEEVGGLNLYGFVENRPLDRVDFLGLSCCPGDRYGGPAYARTCGLTGCGVQDCTDCYFCAIKETPTGWTSAWRRSSTNCGSCVWSSNYPGKAPAACPSGPPGPTPPASKWAYTQCCNFINGNKTATNCMGCCDLMYKGPPSVPPLDKFPSWSACHAWCLQFPAQ